MFRKGRPSNKDSDYSSCEGLIICITHYGLSYADQCLVYRLAFVVLCFMFRSRKVSNKDSKFSLHTYSSVDDVCVLFTSSDRIHC